MILDQRLLHWHRMIIVSMFIPHLLRYTMSMAVLVMKGKLRPCLSGFIFLYGIVGKAYIAST